LYGIGEHGMAVIAWSLTGSLLPFFYFNVFGGKNKLFMGDTGSLIIGLLMALFASVICGRELPENHLLYMKAAPAVLFAVLIYPLFDLLRIVSIRVINGNSPFVADRQHIHHLFLSAGYSHRRSTFYILLISALDIIWALIFRNAPILLVGLSLLASSALITHVVEVTGKRRLKKAIKP
jgi:UDP-GlcNAc:undecaprenyl-phosphate GlcNAc-1-phosphate transferase